MVLLLVAGCDVPDHGICCAERGERRRALEPDDLDGATESRGVLRSVAEGIVSDFVQFCEEGEKEGGAN
jgi:hypothetical protein